MVDGFDGGWCVKVIGGEKKMVGYSRGKSGGVGGKLKNYLVIEFDKGFSYEGRLCNDVEGEKGDGSVGVRLKEGKVEESDLDRGGVMGLKRKKGEVVDGGVGC